MPFNIEHWLLRFEALSQREKLMVTGATLLIIWACWDNLVQQTLDKQRNDLASSISTLERNLSTQQMLSAQLKQSSGQNANQQKLAQLRQSVDSLQHKLDAGEKKFVPPQQMATALRDILQRQGNLKLLKLETLPVTPFGQEEQQPAWVYRHSLAITVQGDFFSTLEYLKALEALSWRIHWASIDYQVKNYPIAETRLQVYTLSFEKDWLGA